MGTLDAEAVAIIADVRRAFAGVSRGAVTLHEAEAMDDYAGPEWRAEARRLDPDGPWEAVPDAHLAGCPWGMPYLDPQSWAFYIPAYIVWSLRHEDDGGHLVHNFLIYTFAHTAPDPEPNSLEHYRLLTPAQAAAVCRFLRYRAAGDFDGDVAREALETYWGQRDEGGAGASNPL